MSDTEDDDVKEVPVAQEGMTELQKYYENDELVPPKNRITFLIMLCTSAIPNFDVETIEPYKTLIQMKGQKSLYKPTKKMLGAECKRRCPNSGPNIKNKTAPQLYSLLEKWPLADEELTWLKGVEKQYRQTMIDSLVAEEAKEDNTITPISRDDRMRFFIIFDEDEQIRAKYALTQDSMKSQQLDGRDSDKKEPDFYDLIVEKFNDDTYIAKSLAFPTMHDDFQIAHEYRKGSYTLTLKKVKGIIAFMMPKIMRICNDYMASGNGSEQLDFDNDAIESHDSDNEDDRGMQRIQAGHRLYGHYNPDLAAMKDGDDRAAFLKNESSELLYWWYVLDTHHLINFTCAKLPQGSGVNVSTAPSPTARGSSSIKRKRQDHDEFGAMIAKSLGAIVSSNSRNRMEDLQKEKFEIEMKLTLMMGQAPRNGPMEALLTKRIEQLEENIQQRQDELDGKDVSVSQVSIL